MTTKTVADLVFDNLGQTGLTTTIWHRTNDVIPAIARAQRAMRIDHPDAFIATAGTFTEITTDPTVDGSALYVDEDWAERLAALATARLLLLKYSDKENVDKAQMWLAVYAAT